MMLRRILVTFFALVLGFQTVLAQGFLGPIPPNLYLIAPGNGDASTGAANQQNCAGDPTQYVAGPFTAPVAVIITTWQSLIENSGQGTYATVNAKALNFSACDRGVYRCLQPVLGAAINGVNTNSANCQIADNLITAGTYATVIMVPTSIGGTLCSDWVGGFMSQKIVATVNGLAARGLTQAAGFTGDTWILPHGGEQDNFAGTPRATLATCIRNFDAAWTAAGLGSHRFFVPTESITGNVASATVTGAQADAVASGCSDCRAGFNVDSLTGGTNRYDGTHLTAAGTAALGTGDTAVVTNCKNTAC